MKQEIIYKPNEEVKIINGIFKGIYGIPVKFETTSINENFKIYIKVDNENIIKVNYNDIEFLYDDYLVLQSSLISEKVIKVIGKYRFKKNMIENFLIDLYDQSPNENVTFTAVSMNNVKFKLEGLELSINEIKKLIK